VELRSKLNALSPHTVRDEILGSLKMMGPLTGEELVARCELQVTEKVSGPMSWAVCDVLNRLIREKEVAIDGSCNAYDLAKNIMV